MIPPNSLRSQSSAGRKMSAGSAAPIFLVTEYGAQPGLRTLQTESLQAAIDACAAAGSGIVHLPAGVYHSGLLTLRSGVHLQLAEGAILQGSSDFRDYGASGWKNALLLLEGVQNVRLSGPGLIDGADAESPTGEEGFRGPHTIRVNDCSNVEIDELTIANSGNYAVYCQNSREITVRHLKVRGGHDGIHLQACKGIRVEHSDLRTGDDCVAGTDNCEASFTSCYFNSSCNAFRFGCDGLVVRHCTFRGPGEFAHRISVKRGSPRLSMGSAFIHFAPADRNPRIPSDRWLIEDCRIESVEHLYHYNHADGLWQTGQPARHLLFRNIQGISVARPFDVRGDAQRQLHLEVIDVTLEQSEPGDGHAAVSVESFGRCRIRNLVLSKCGADPAVILTDGDRVEWEPGPGAIGTKIFNVTEVVERNSSAAASV